MVGSRWDHPRLPRIPEPLAGVLAMLATEGADEEAGPDEERGHMWAALFRGGPELAGRARETVESGAVDVRPEEIPPESWALLEAAAGVVVMQDVSGRVVAQPYEADDELAAAWSAVMADLEPGEPGAPTVQSPDADENPT